MKLPNGYGSVYKLSNAKHRRKPYCVRKTWYDNGERKVKYLGYFMTKTEAINFLAEYNKKPQEKGCELTFAELYTLWSEWKFPNISQGTIKYYQVAYNKCSTIYKCNFVDITQDTLQGVIDNVESISTKANVLNLFRGMYDYAVRKQLITPDKDRTSYLDVPKKEKSTKHRRLTNEELVTLWENRDDELIAIFLILIYTGCRPMELFSLTPNQVHETYFEILKGKTENAKRVVPIHNKIKPLFEYMRYDIVTQNDYTTWLTYTFAPTMRALNIECTPYDARHTFATLWAEQRLDENIRRKIQGHSSQGIGQSVYTHYDIDVLCEELNKLNVVDK